MYPCLTFSNVMFRCQNLIGSYHQLIVLPTLLAHHPATDVHIQIHTQTHSHSHTDTYAQTTDVWSIHQPSLKIAWQSEIFQEGWLCDDQLQQRLDTLTDNKTTNLLPLYLAWVWLSHLEMAQVTLAIKYHGSFPHSCKQTHQLEAQWFVWNCPPEPRPNFFIFAH